VIKEEAKGEGDQSDPGVESISITHDSIVLPIQRQQPKLHKYMQNTPLRPVLLKPHSLLIKGRVIIKEPKTIMSSRSHIDQTEVMTQRRFENVRPLSVLKQQDKSIRDEAS
jgi:hypothetical protein